MIARQNIILQLKELGVLPNKERGQNFLLDSGALSDLILFGKPNACEQIIEIGPGLGALTSELLIAKKLILVELQTQFAEYLSRKYEFANVYNLDIRKFNLHDLDGQWTVFGNLPYSLSTEIIIWLINNHSKITRAVVLLQKEFAERIYAKPGTKDYGSLSLQVQLIANVQAGPLIAGDCFYPAAAVISQVIEIKFLSAPRFLIANKDVFDRLIRGAFLKRRKKLLNSLMAANVFDTELLKNALSNLNFDMNARAEQVTLMQFVELANEIEKNL